MKKKGLGKGLEALFDDNYSDTDSGGATTEVRLSDIEPNPDQPRKSFDDEALRGLAESIAQNGIIQPLIVRELENGRYQIIAGERRWRAARIAGLSMLPVVVRDMGDDEALSAALIENLQREDLNPVEEGMGYRDLSDRFGMTQEEIAKKVGKSRPAVANAMRILDLPDDILEKVASGVISAGHARAILSLGETDMMRKLAGDIEKRGLSVRTAEKMAADMLENRGKEEVRRPTINYFEKIERGLSESLGRKVRVSTKGKRGTLSLEFYDSEDFGKLLESIGMSGSFDE